MPVDKFDPVNPQDVATKEYTDNVRGIKWVKRKQDGTLDMNNKRLKNIPPPVNDADAVNKIYADTLSDETKRCVNSVTPFVNQQNQYAATKVDGKGEIPAKMPYLSQNSHACPRKSHAYAWDSCLLALEKIPWLLVFENPMLIPKKILIHKYLSSKNTYICWAIPHVFVPKLSCLSEKIYILSHESMLIP